MFKFRTIGWGLGIGFILFIIGISGCRTAPAPAPQPTQPSPSSKGTSAAESQAAAESAFRDMENPQSPAASPGPASSSKPSASSTRQETSPAPEDTAPKQVSGNRQDWMDGIRRSYPATQYLTGVGFGESRREAEDNARTEIAKIFVSHVNASTKISQEYLEVVSQGKGDESSRTHVSDMVEVSTQKVLTGVRIVEVFRQTQPEPASYALAVMDRQQTMTILKEKLHNYDQEIQSLMTKASQEKKDLQKIKILTDAMETYLLRQAHEAELTIVDPSGRGMVTPIGLNEIKRPLTDILSRKFRIHVTVSGDRADEIKDSLSQGLTREGFVLTNDPQNAQVSVKGNVTIRPLDRPDEKWKYMRWQTAFKLVDLSDGTVFGTLSNNGREGHLSREQAVNRCIMKIQNELLPIVSKDVYNYIFGKYQ